MYYADLFAPPNGTNDFSLDYALVGMASSSRLGSRGGGAMMKRIGGLASFHRGMSGLSARVTVHVQLTCGSGMALTGLGGITSSVPIRTRTLWYGGNFFVLFKFRTVSYICWPLREIKLFLALQISWIDWHGEAPYSGQVRIPTKESKSQYLQLMEEMRERRARQLEARWLDIQIKDALRLWHFSGCDDWPPISIRVHDRHKHMCHGSSRRWTL
jgi:hypothetical protein